MTDSLLMSESFCLSPWCPKDIVRDETPLLGCYFFEGRDATILLELRTVGLHADVRVSDVILIVAVMPH